MDANKKNKPANRMLLSRFALMVISTVNPSVVSVVIEVLKYLLGLALLIRLALLYLQVIGRPNL